MPESKLPIPEGTVQRRYRLRPRESQAPDPERIVKRAQALLTKRANVDNLQQELADYFIPRKAVITERRASEGEELTERVWTSVPIRANELLAARMQGALTSPSVRWYSLKTRDERNNELFAVKEWLAAVEDRMYLAMRQSNFNQEMGEVYLDLGAFGIGAVLIEEHPKEIPGFNGFLFVGMAPGTYAIAESAAGEVNTLYRFVSMTVAQCVQEFGLDALPQEWRDLNTTNPDSDKELIHAIEPRRVDNPKRKDTLHLPWSSVWVTKQDKTVLRESGYHEFPAIVPRWSKTTGEVYGRGPGHTALPDVRTLNRIKELGLQALAKVVDPPGLTSSDAGIAELDLRPGSQNTVDGDPKMAWMPLESGARFDVQQLAADRLEADIRNTFYWDQLQLASDRQMTLGEVQRRLEIMQQFLAPTLARLESEGLAPLLNRCFGLMWRAGALPPPPEELQGQQLDIEYEGPLARSQKTTRLAGFEEFVRLTAPMEARNPAAADNLDDDYTYRDLGEVAGLPTKYFRSESDRDEVRAQRQQAQQAQASLDRATQVAEAAGKVAPMLATAQQAQGQNGAAAPDIQGLLDQFTAANGSPR
jgi:head-to-tail connecting protein